MSATLRSTLSRAFRRAALPLACYYAVTLALPLANGAAYAGSAFAAHALAVLVLPPILIGLVCALLAAGRAFCVTVRRCRPCPIDHRGPP